MQKIYKLRDKLESIIEKNNLGELWDWKLVESNVRKLIYRLKNHTQQSAVIKNK